MSQRAIGAKTYGPPYKDPDLPLDEFCACTKRLWSLTEYNVQKHLFGENSGGGGPDYKKRRFEIQQGQDLNIKKKKQLKLFDRVRLSYSIFARLRRRSGSIGSMGCCCIAGTSSIFFVCARAIVIFHAVSAHST